MTCLCFYVLRGYFISDKKYTTYYEYFIKELHGLYWLGCLHPIITTKTSIPSKQGKGNVEKKQVTYVLWSSYLVREKTMKEVK